MDDSSRTPSRIGENRLAAAVAVGSLAVVIALAVLYWTSVLEVVVPPGGPAADSLPLYGLFAVALIGLVIWGWSRLLSFFE
ncbi:hypothetical protein [Natrononativus amylolyticus]|uniref:hypothetical protein n=1 Tax=Natrononativus amylolyticus TaxID=2963434 RepID=UPI0020CB7A47|nr:hypothetical protein [Natrononativus amylolyticus]